MFWSHTEQRVPESAREGESSEWAEEGELENIDYVERKLVNQKEYGY